MASYIFFSASSRVAPVATQPGRSGEYALRELKVIAEARTLELGDHFTFTTIAGNFDCFGRPRGSSGYEPLARTATKLDVGGVTVLVASLEDLIQMKRAAGRPKDLIEVEILSAVRDEIEGS